MSGHVKVLDCILLLKVMRPISIRYFTKIFCDEQELMKTYLKVLVCRCMTLKLNSHDMMMVSFCKACIDLLDKSSSSQNEWNG